MTLAVTLTVDELRALVRDEVRAAIPTPVPESAEILTREQVATLLQVNAHHIPLLIKKHGLPAHRLGNQWRFRREEVLGWLSTRENEKTE